MLFVFEEKNIYLDCCHILKTISICWSPPCLHFALSSIVGKHNFLMSVLSHIFPHFLMIVLSVYHGKIHNCRNILQPFSRLMPCTLNRNNECGNSFCD